MTAPVSGVSAPLPYDLHPWSPVVYTDTGAALTLPLSASGAAAGASTRRGTAPALTAPLTASAAAGQPARRGTGAACVLPLTAASPATGQAITVYFAGPGAAILLPFTQASGIGRKQVSLQAGLLGLPLVDNPASGIAVRQGSGTSCLLGLQLGVMQGSKAAAGVALGADLRISAGQGDGRRYEWIFLTPTEQDWQPFSTVYPSVLNYGIPYSSTVWQDADGEWHTARGPNPTLLVGALRIYEGGRLYALSTDDIAVLTAAGFADNLILQEMH